jgi:GGDEF domain-containing protein
VGFVIVIRASTTMTCIYSISRTGACIAIYGGDVFTVICLNCTLQQALTLALPSTSVIRMPRPTLVTLLTWVVPLWVSCLAAMIIPSFIYPVSGSVTFQFIQCSCTL